MFEQPGNETDALKHLDMQPFVDAFKRGQALLDAVGAEESAYTALLDDLKTVIDGLSLEALEELFANAGVLVGAMRSAGCDELVVDVRFDAIVTMPLITQVMGDRLVELKARDVAEDPASAEGLVIAAVMEQTGSSALGA